MITAARRPPSTVPPDPHPHTLGEAVHHHCRGSHQLSVWFRMLQRSPRGTTYCGGPHAAVHKDVNRHVGIPKHDMRHIHANVETAVPANLNPNRTFSDQKRHMMVATTSYLEPHEPCMAPRVRSTGACALMPHKFNNRSIYVRGAESTSDPRAVSDGTDVAVVTAGTMADEVCGASGTAGTDVAAVGGACTTGQHAGPPAGVRTRPDREQAPPVQQMIYFLVSAS